MSKIIYAGRFMMELLLAMAIGFIPVGVGLMAILHHQEKILAENSFYSVQDAIISVDRSLERLQAAANSALMLGGKPCEEVRQKLHDQVDITPDLRSLALMENNKTYCNTLGTSTHHDKFFAEAQAPLQLMFDTPASPGRVILSYQVRRDTFSAIATTFATQLRNELHGFQNGLTVMLEFGDSYVWALGDSRDPGRPSLVEHVEIGVSERYGYTVKAGYLRGHGAHEARQAIMQTLPSLVLVGIVTGSIFYWAVFGLRGIRQVNAANKA
ncbi:CSS-motif domain-containing protein [Pseudomonas sp. NPDC089752]|uniref:CSS-motif domain-containing protein n=1 Tax=Pseudomonas sp. NPDC089752 TaxID=3364472 RepID=UPI00381CC619